MDARRRVLFLCTGNSCRSHMGEALLRHEGGDRYVAQSAGARPSGTIHTVATTVMAELGIDLSAHRSKSIDEFLPPSEVTPHVIVSVCSNADRDCPVFPGEVTRLRWPLPDPAAIDDEDEQLRTARLVRDELKKRIREAIASGSFD